MNPFEPALLRVRSNERFRLRSVASGSPSTLTGQVTHNISPIGTPNKSHARTKSQSKWNFAALSTVHARMGTWSRDFKDESLRHFNRIAGRYDRHRYGKQTSRVHRQVRRIVEPLQPRSLLDVGCANGGFLALMRAENRTLAGADLSPEMIQCAKERLGERPICAWPIPSICRGMPRLVRLPDVQFFVPSLSQSGCGLVGNKTRAKTRRPFGDF